MDSPSLRDHSSKAREEEEEDNDEGGLHSFLKELSRLQEASRERTRELQSAQRDVAVLHQQVASWQQEEQTEHQATLEAELELVRAEVSCNQSRSLVESSRALMEDVERRRGEMQELLHRAATPLERTQSCWPSLCASPEPSLTATLRCVSLAPPLLQEYLLRLSALLDQVYTYYNRVSPGSSSLRDASPAAFADFRSWLLTVVPNVSFTDEEWAVLEFLRCGGGEQ